VLPQHCCAGAHHCPKEVNLGSGDAARNPSSVVVCRAASCPHLSFVSRLLRLSRACFSQSRGHSPASPSSGEGALFCWTFCVIADPRFGLSQRAAHTHTYIHPRTHNAHNQHYYHPAASLTQLQSGSLCTSTGLIVIGSTDDSHRHKSRLHIICPLGSSETPPSRGRQNTLPSLDLLHHASRPRGPSHWPLTAPLVPPTSSVLPV
jgi:hypothetical protein